MVLMVNRSERDQFDTGLMAPRRTLKRRTWYFAILFMAALVLVTTLIELFDVDRRLAACFYRPGVGWYLARAPVWLWLYRYGTLPGLLLTLGALVVYLAGLYVQRLKKWRKPCLLVVLTTVIAAGLLVNAVLKQYWGRPRPDQTTEFGGKWDYRPIFPPGPPGKGASFPCGHCTMGFVFLAAAGFRRQSKALSIGGVATGIVLGVLLSIARIVQGAHFLSDTIWSFGIVAMTAFILHACFISSDRESRRPADRPWARSRKIMITAAAVIGALIMAGGFMTRRPFYSTMIYPLELEPALQSISIRINADPERISVRYSDLPSGRLQIDAHGFGWLKFDYRLGFDDRIEDLCLFVNLDVKARSYFAELDHAITLTLPRRFEDKVSVKVNGHYAGDVRP